ncbi:MAG: dTDP-3-amino-3,4,6-trideoxy-alpha-D-glucose transaminase [Calditrichaeota bacterium]|nr:dTDP-3-amino-3,4,6-trideoxy-alpha-D-glucose transaminase [Calditrichota bacterium]
MAVPLLDLKAQYETIRDEVMEQVAEVLESQYFILGPKVKELEAAVADYSGTKHAVGVSSGTDALLISLMAAEIGPGDEVITTPFSFFSTAGCVARVGARPVFVDIDPASFNLDPGKFEDAVSERTKAVIPIHLYGQPAAMDPIMDIARRHGLTVIEDAAQAVGAEYRGKRAGSIGDYGCFSFFPSKNLGAAGDGGMVVTNNDENAEKLRILRVHGGRPKYYHRVIGGNFRLDAIQAAVLLVKIRRLDRWTAVRRKNAGRYRDLFKQAGLAIEPTGCFERGCHDWPDCELQGRNGVVLPQEVADRHIYNQFVIRVDRRDELRAHLKQREIGHEVYYPVPFHVQECFAYLGYKQGDFPASECAAATSLALPIYPELTEAQMREVVDAIGEFFL